jgi:hypothetical protein
LLNRLAQHFFVGQNQDFCCAKPKCTTIFCWAKVTFLLCKTKLHSIFLLGKINFFVVQNQIAQQFFVGQKGNFCCANPLTLGYLFAFLNNEGAKVNPIPNTL